MAPRGRTSRSSDWWQTHRLALDDYELVAPAADRTRQGATCQVPSGVRTAMSRW